MGVIWDVGGEEGGDGGEEMMEEPGAAGIASPARGAGSAGPWLALAAQPAVPGQVQGPGIHRDGEPPQDGLVQGFLLSGWGSRALPLTTEWSNLPAAGIGGTS